MLNDSPLISITLFAPRRRDEYFTRDWLIVGTCDIASETCMQFLPRWFHFNCSIIAMGGERAEHSLVGHASKKWDTNHNFASCNKLVGFTLQAVFKPHILGDYSIWREYYVDLGFGCSAILPMQYGANSKITVQSLQRSAKVGAPGLVSLITAVASLLTQLACSILATWCINFGRSLYNSGRPAARTF